MVRSTMVGIIFLKSLSLDFSSVVDLWADTRNVCSSVHDNRDTQHAVPKKRRSETGKKERKDESQKMTTSTAKIAFLDMPCVCRQKPKHLLSLVGQTYPFVFTSGW